MHVKPEEIHAVRLSLELTTKEARILMGLLQNPQMPDEPADVAAVREGIFLSIHQIMGPAKR